MNEITVFGVVALTFMMAMYSLEGRDRRFTLAFAIRLFAVQRIRLPDRRLAFWCRGDHLVRGCLAEVSIATHQPSFKLKH